MAGEAEIDITQAVCDLGREGGDHPATAEQLFSVTVEQAAEVLGVSPRTVDNDWRHAQAWLRHELSPGSNRG